MTATNAKAPGVSAEGLQENHQTNSESLPPLGHSCNGLTPEQNQVTAVIEALGRRGHTVHALPDGTWIVARWGLSKCIPGPDLTALIAFARMVGVA